MAGLDGLDLPGRAAAFKRSCGAFLVFAERHRELFARPALLASDGAVARILRHEAAGEPEPDFTRLVFLGADEVRAILIATLRTFPAALSWHCIEFVSFLEVGRSVGGWMCSAPPVRSPAGDTGHLIVINGATPDAALPHLIAHEVGHSWHRFVAVRSNEVPRPSEHELLARQLVAYEHDAAELARVLYREEVLADTTAAALGFPASGHSSDAVRLRGFEAAIAAVTDLADEIAADFAQPIAACRSTP